MKKVRSLALLGYYGNGNTGDEALLMSVLTNIEGWEGIGAVTVLSGDPESTRRQHKSNAVHNYLPTSFLELVIGTLGRNWRAFFQSVAACLRSDTVVVGGGGLFFDREDHNRHVVRLLRTLLILERLGKEIYMIGIGANRFHHRGTSVLFRQVVNHRNMKLIVCRDPETTELLKEYCQDTEKVHMTDDLAFGLSSSLKDTSSRHFRDVYLDRERVNVGLALCGHSLKTNARYASVIRQSVARLVELGFNVIGLPMSVGMDDDREGMGQCLEEMVNHGQVRIVREGYTVAETIAAIGALDCVIAERLHANILAFVAGTPVVGISYAPKVRLLFEGIGKEAWQAPISSLTPEWLVRTVQESILKKSEIQSEIRRILAEKRVRALRSFTLLAAAM